jgi:hypothetical protein
MRIEYPHKLSRDEARQRLQALGEYLQKRHGITISWPEADRAVVRGKYMVVAIEGEMRLGDDAVLFEGKDPGMLFRKKARDYLVGKLDIYLDAATPAAELPRG